MKPFQLKPESTTRSPLKTAPLRIPRQSIEEQRRKILDDIETSFIGALFVVLLACLEWWRWLFSIPPFPKLYSVCALVVVGWAFYKVRPRFLLLRQLRLARDGELAVGQYLEHLRERGYQVLHDLVGQGFNVDHVLIGPAGIFAVETKTISKPAHGRPEVVYDGERVTVGGFTPDRDPIIQGKAQAHWLRTLIEETTGKHVEVRALVVYPGWFVTVTSRANAVMVLNPKALPGLLDKLPERLSPEDRKLVAYHLSRYARAAH